MYILFTLRIFYLCHVEQNGTVYRWEFYHVNITTQISKEKKTQTHTLLTDLLTPPILGLMSLFRYSFDLDMIDNLKKATSAEYQ